MTLELTPHDLTVTQPAKIRAWVDDAWQDVAIPKTPKGAPRWRMVTETLQTLQASRVQLMDDSGAVMRAIGDPPPARPAELAPAPAAASVDPDVYAQRLAEAQRVALSAHIEAMRPAWDAVTKSTAQIEKMAAQMTAMLAAAVEGQKSQMELAVKLANMLADVTDDAVATRLEAADAVAESAAAAVESGDGNKDRVADMMEKALELLGPAMVERMAPH